MEPVWSHAAELMSHTGPLPALERIEIWIYAFGRMIMKSPRADDVRPIPHLLPPFVPQYESRVSFEAVDNPTPLQSTLRLQYCGDGHNADRGRAGRHWARSTVTTPRHDSCTMEAGGGAASSPVVRLPFILTPQHGTCRQRHATLSRFVRCVLRRHSPGSPMQRHTP